MYSLSKQDEFVLSLIPKGYYLEIGANHPININNTYLLEQNGWDGLSIDIDRSWLQPWQDVRKNTLIIADAIEIPYTKDKRIDYLSIDIEPAINTFRCLKHIFKFNPTISIITFEHDWYYDQSTKMDSRKYLTDMGFELVHADVECHLGAYEDWWVNPKTVSVPKAKEYKL